MMAESLVDTVISDFFRGFAAIVVRPYLVRP
jgi:hypothetical protein